MRAVRWLNEITEHDHPEVGGKAFVLGRLRQAGFPVPDGFVIAAGAAWDDAARALAARAFATLGAPVAVRSSGTAEDGASASFAGQYLTVLDVKDEAHLLEAIARCRAAAAGAGAYAGALSASTGAMAVLVQRFIEPRTAGVVFTRDPRDASRALVEAFAGRGEELVSGRVTPARYSVDRAGSVVAGADSVLSAAEAAELVALARRVETHLGAPQDVEWAWDAAGIALVQARPITVEAPPAVDPRLGRLTRANVGEVLPGPVTPLTYSAVRYFLEEVFRRISARLDIAPPDPPPFLVLHHRHLYFNLDLCIDIATRLGAPPQDAERMILGGGATAGHGAKFGKVPGLRTMVGGLGIARALRPRIDAADAIVAAFPGAGAIAGATPAQLLERLDGLTEDCIEVAFTHITTSGASAMTMMLLSALLARDGRGDSMERTGRLLAGLDGVDSVAPALALETIAARARQDDVWRAWLARSAAEAAAAFARRDLPPSLSTEIESFLVRFGHRGVAEGDLSTRSWDEDPVPVFESLKALMRSGRSPGFGSRARTEIRRADEDALLSRAGPLGRVILGRAIANAQAWVRRREHTKSLLVASIRHGRRLMQAAGAHLVRRGALPEIGLLDYLTWEEIRAALEGAAVPVAEAQRRRRRHLTESRLPVPREIDMRCPPGAEVEAAVAPTDRLRGIGVSAGVAIGRARVIHSPDGSLQPGEILVTPVLDAGLAPLLATAAGAVAEIGGILSHGSVVAREMGVPCVVDVRGATRWIADGQRIVVDGGAGTIVRLAEETAAEEAGAHVAADLTPAGDDELALHPLEDHPRARESVYLNMRDAARGLALVFSMAVRPGGRGEALLTLSLPDGRVLFAVELGHAEIDAAGFRVGGFRLDWRPLRLTLDADVTPYEAAAFPPGPIPLLMAPRTVRLRGTLVLEPTTSAIDFCALLPEEAREWLRPLGRHHVEQSGRWRGELAVDGHDFPFDGRGSRDHSWGRREWAAADYWRLFMAPINDRLSVHALITSTNSRLVTGGVLWRDGRAEPVSRVEYAAERDTSGRPRSFGLELTTPSGPARLRGHIEHTVSIPVDPERRLWRHLAGRPYALVLHENFTRYEMDGEIGHGMAEITERRP